MFFVNLKLKKNVRLYCYIDSLICILSIEILFYIEVD